MLVQWIENEVRTVNQKTINLRNFLMHEAQTKDDSFAADCGGYKTHTYVLAIL